MELVERRRSTGKLDHLVRQKQRKLGPDIGTNFMSRQALFCTFLHPLLCSTETSRVFDVLCSGIYCSLPLMVFPLSFFLPLLKGQCCFSGQQKGKRERKGGGIPISRCPLPIGLIMSIDLLPAISAHCVVSVHWREKEKERKGALGPDPK